VLRELRRLPPGRWQKVIKQGNSREVHYFEYSSRHVAEANTSLHGNGMRQQQSSRIILSATKGTIAQQQELFALLNLGLLQSLASGVVSPTEAVERFYHGENCLYVQKHFRQKATHTLMSHGVQLPDLFESLPAEEAQREVYHELEIMRSLCLQLLEKRRSPGAASRVAA
jgi:hypothetical protein